MKKRLVLLVVLTVILASCAAVPNGQVEDPATQVEYVAHPASDTQEGSPGKGDAESKDPGQIEELSEGEIAGLLFMREEEKLARDVYLKMSDVWGLSIFNNIASSEQVHIDAVLGLIEAAGVEDPASSLVNGEFNNPELQELYDELVFKGSQSLEQALLVGGAIEEIDILDLQNYLAETDNSEIKRVYQNLLKGSINHLKAFSSNYTRQFGEDYQLQFLSPVEYDDLVQGSSSQGGGRGQGRGWGKGRRN